MAGLKKTNEYSELVNDIYDRTPKAVFAAIAVSEYINRLNIPIGSLSDAVLKEWGALYKSGIVPQKPPNQRCSGRGKTAPLN